MGRVWGGDRDRGNNRGRGRDRGRDRGKRSMDSPSTNRQTYWIPS